MQQWVESGWFNLGLIVAKVTLLMLLVSGVYRLLRRASAAYRHGVLAAGLVGALLIPVLAVVLPPIKAPLPTKAQPAKATRRATMTMQIVPMPSALFGLVPVDPRPLAAQVMDKPQPTPIAVPVKAPAAPAWDAAATIRLVVIAWLIGAAALSVRYLRAATRLVQVRKRSCSSIPYPTRGLVADVEDKLRLTRKVSVRFAHSGDRIYPMTWSALRPVILFPSDFADWPSERQYATIEHEFAHIRRCDWLWQLFANFACVAFWFHPMVWWAAQRLRLEAEHACDDLVIESGLRPSTYASQLLEVVQHMNPNRLKIRNAVSMAEEGQLEARVKAILAPNRSRKGLAAWTVLVSAAAALGLIAPFAALKFKGHDANGDAAPLPPRVNFLTETAAVAPAVTFSEPAVIEATAVALNCNTADGVQEKKIKTSDAKAKLRKKIAELDSKLERASEKNKESAELEILRSVRDILSEVLENLPELGELAITEGGLTVLPPSAPQALGTMPGRKFIAPKSPKPFIVEKGKDGKSKVREMSPAEQAEFEKKMEAWGEEFGKQMEDWGEKYGDEMAKWGEKLGDHFKELRIEPHSWKIDGKEMTPEQRAKFEKDMAERMKGLREKIHLNIKDLPPLRELRVAPPGVMVPGEPAMPLFDQRAALEGLAEAKKELDKALKQGDMSKAEHERAMKALDRARQTLDRKRVRFRTFSPAQPGTPAPAAPARPKVSPEDPLI